nr:DNA-dependent metalloprotease SPRTN isoform X4 [Caretta caretta]
MDGDFLLALRLQAQWEEEEEAAAVAACSEFPRGSSAPPRPLSVVDEAWELLDPSPDVRGLFVQFNETLFWGKLAAVAVTWSPRMTLCAGVCSYEGRGGMCSIRLSEPLLKLRPRKDLVETLLHEMIHALLFVTNNDKDHESHGPEFCKHMRRINRMTGANVTIYHDFHDEVDSYRQHWWRCNGPCQSRKPYYGYVKRAMNRAPSARDFWWSDHQQTCGGTFSKVKEPENYSKKGKEKTQLGKLSNSEPSDTKGDDFSRKLQLRWLTHNAHLSPTCQVVQLSSTQLPKSTFFSPVPHLTSTDALLHYQYENIQYIRLKYGDSIKLNIKNRKGTVLIIYMSCLY